MKPDPFASGGTPERRCDEYSMPARDRSECSPQGADGGPGKFVFQLPPLARAIVEISRNDRASLKNLADVVVAEPLFGARLLGAAKFFPGLAQKPATTTQVINSFGTDHLKALAVGVSLFEMQSAPPKEDIRRTTSPAYSRLPTICHASTLPRERSRW